MSNEENKSSDVQVSETFTEPNGMTLAETLCTLPIINDSINTAKKYRIGRLTIDGAYKVSDLAKPVFSSGHIEKVDKIAAASVQRLSDTFPLVKEPTDKIINTFKEPAMQTFETVKQYHEQLGCTIEDNITTPGKGFALKVDSQLAPFVNIMEDLVQKMIPDENGKTREIQNDQQQQIVQTLRVLQLAMETRNRCFEKVKKQITYTQSYTTEQLKQLQASNQLLNKATGTVLTLNQALLGMVLNLRDTVQNPDLAVNLQNRLQYFTSIFKDEENIPKAVQSKIIAYSSTLLAATNDISSYIKSNAPHFPAYLQDRLKPLVTFFEERYGDIVNEINNGKGSPLEKARNILQLTTNQTLPLLRSSLTDLQEAVNNYTNSLNTSLHNQLNNASQILNVK